MARSLRITQRPRRRRNAVPLLATLAALVVAAALAAAHLDLWQGEAGVAVVHGPSQRDHAEVSVFRGSAARPASETGSAPTGAGDTFALCDRPPHRDCVIDGDTFYAGDIAVRIADIDAPEIHEPACTREADLGALATRRLLALLNGGPFVLQDGGLDPHGRRLQTVLRDGRSIGAMLVAEGLAEPWRGPSARWCG